MGPSPSRELQLKAFVANTGVSLTLTVSEDAELKDLRSLLRLQDPDFFRRGAGGIEIYTAKKPDGSWLRVTLEQQQQIKSGDRVPREIFQMLHPVNSVLLCTKMSDFAFPPADQMEADAYHLLMERLGDVRVVGEPTWKEEPPFLPILLEGLVYRVPRTTAVKELQGVHLANFNQFHNPSQSRKWVVPVADHVSGIGKTVLASYYIRWCREMWPEVNNRNAFQQELCSCHTVYPSAPSPELLGGKITGDLVKRSLLGAINAKLKPDTKLEVADLLSKDLGSLTLHLVDTLGPLFIVLDDMDDWFRRVDALKAHRWFLQFCEDFIHVWMKVPGVYVVVLGYSDLLQCVDEQATTTDNGTAFVFKRLSLYLFRPKEIEQILCKTQVRSGSIKTLRQRWGLATDEDVTEAARLLFERSAGFPRVVCQHVLTYRTLADLKKEKFPELAYRAQKYLHHELRKHQTLLREWLIDKKLVNLREDAEVGAKERLCLWNVALLCKLGWEGTLEEAKLFALPEVKREILNLVYPLNDYVRAVAGTLAYPHARVVGCVQVDVREALE